MLFMTSEVLFHNCKKGPATELMWESFIIFKKRVFIYVYLKTTSVFGYIGVLGLKLLKVS